MCSEFTSSFATWAVVYRFGLLYSGCVAKLTNDAFSSFYAADLVVERCEVRCEKAFPLIAAGCKALKVPYWNLHGDVQY